MRYFPIRRGKSDYEDESRPVQARLRILIWCRNLIEVTQSMYRYFVRSGSPRRILDLGCNDDLIVQELLKVDNSIDVTLVDGSHAMLEAAGKRLAHFEREQFLKASFQAQWRILCNA
jgi:ubiquinone/menaquinone biosynthesis C-methylase UbiE